MSFLKGLKEWWDSLRGKGPAAAVALTLDLGEARDNKAFNLEAGSIFVEKCEGDLYAKVNGPNGDGINFYYVRKILYPVTSLYLTNSAQAGKSARLLLLPMGMEADPPPIPVPFRLRGPTPQLILENPVPELGCEIRYGPYYVICYEPTPFKYLRIGNPSLETIFWAKTYVSFTEKELRDFYLTIIQTAHAGGLRYDNVLEKIRWTLNDDFSERYALDNDDIGGWRTARIPTSAPGSPQVGDSYYNAATDTFYIYDGTQWRAH